MSEQSVSPVRDRNPLCTLCQTLNIWEHLTATRTLTKRDWILSFIASPDDVDSPERQTCPFCSMVFRLLPSNAFAAEHVAQYHGRTKYCDIQPRTIRLGRKAIFTSFRVVYNYCQYVSHTRKVYQAHRGQVALDSADRQRWNVEHVSPIRLQATLDLASIRRWLRLCQVGHSVCRGLQSSHTAASLDIMLIDVNRGCLVDATTTERYVCLSYVWGQVPTLQACRANIESLRKPNSLFQVQVWNSLTAVVRDFVHVVQQLGVQFAWVDCLCIVQDDPASKQAQINAMDVIYSAAWLSVIQLSGADANDGLAGTCAGTRGDCASPSVASSTLSSKNLQLVLTELPRWTQVSRDESAYRSRGWTLQEELLSNRCLYLSRWGCWFQCQQSTFSDTATGDTMMSLNGLDLLPIPSQLPNTRTLGAEHTDVEQVLHWAVRAEWYSGRQLTYECDREAAFQGVLSHLGRTQSQQFLWGHPENHLFHLSLLWVSVDTPRAAAAGLLQPPYTPDGALNVKYWDYVPDSYRDFPTWSWLRLRSEVSFELVLMMHAAGVSRNLHPSCRIETRYTLDEEVETCRGVDQHLDPGLFRRHCRRGTLDITAPTITSQNIRWHIRGGPQTHTLDGSSGRMALASDLYEDPQATNRIRVGSTVSNMPDADSKPCGLLYGEPFTGDNVDSYCYVLLRILANDGGSDAVQHYFDRLVPSLWGDGEVVLAVAMYTVGNVAERVGLAFFKVSFWESRGPSTQAWQLI